MATGVVAVETSARASPPAVAGLSSKMTLAISMTTVGLTVPLTKNEMRTEGTGNTRKKTCREMRRGGWMELTTKRMTQ